MDSRHSNVGSRRNIISRKDSIKKNSFYNIRQSPKHNLNQGAPPAKIPNNPYGGGGNYSKPF
jgi:hypothetical protein